MALPTPKTVDTAPVATATAPAVAVAEKTAANIKQFGPAKDANDVHIAAPKPLGIDLVELAKELAASVTSKLADAKVDVQAFIAALELNKEQVPGHKEGRIAYGMANVVTNIFKYVGLATKERGAGGFAKMKADIIKKDEQVNKLRAQLIKLGLTAEQIDAELNG